MTDVESDAMTPQAVAEYAVWYARKVKGPAAKVAAALLEEFPWLREPLEAATPAGTLDEAWAAAEAALPEGHVLAELRLFDDRTRWGASTDNETGVGRYHWSGDGLTPAAALLDLARVLREAK